MGSKIVDNQNQQLLTDWAPGNIVTSTRLNKLQQAIRNLDSPLYAITYNSNTLTTLISNNLTVNNILRAKGVIIESNNNSNVTIGVKTYIDNAVEIRNNSSLTVAGSITANNITTGSFSVNNNATILNNLTVNNTITSKKVTLSAAQNPDTVADNDLISKSYLTTMLSRVIPSSEVNERSISANNDGLKVIKSIQETNGIIDSITLMDIPAASDSTNGLMTIAQNNRLNNLKVSIRNARVVKGESGLVIQTDNTATATAFNSTNIAPLGPIITNINVLLDEYNSLANTVSLLDGGEDGESGVASAVSELQRRVDTIEPVIEEIGGTLGELNLEVGKLNANLPTTAGDYKLHVTMEDDNPVYTWVSIEDNGGEST